MVPKKLRGRVIELGHEGHQGLVKMKQRLRTKVWWPGIDKDAENFARHVMVAKLWAGYVILNLFI